MFISWKININQRLSHFTNRKNESILSKTIFAFMFFFSSRESNRRLPDRSKAKKQDREKRQKYGIVRSNR